MEFLTTFIALLETEKEALIKNDGATIAKIVEEKKAFVEAFPTTDFSGINREALEKAVQHIRHLQGTNLLLTKQAMQYQATIMQALSKGAQKAGKMYSKLGQHAGVDQASILNQSL